MEMSVREARARFAHALAAAERGERVVITKHGKPIAELGPPAPKAEVPPEDFWARNERIRKELGLDKKYGHLKLDEKWLEEFNDAAENRKLFGLGDDWDPNRPW